MLFNVTRIAYTTSLIRWMCSSKTIYNGEVTEITSHLNFALETIGLFLLSGRENVPLFFLCTLATSLALHGKAIISASLISAIEAHWSHTHMAATSINRTWINW